MGMRAYTLTHMSTHAHTHTHTHLYTHLYTHTYLEMNQLKRSNQCCLRWTCAIGTALTFWS
jgi:hypothetical protein